MKREKIDILKDEIVIPDKVKNSIESACGKILQEAALSRKNKEGNDMSKRKFGKKKWIAVALVAVLAAGSMTAMAGAHFNWFPAVEEEMFVSESQKDVLEKYGLGTVVGQSATSAGVTVTLEEVICDSHYFYVVLGVEGMDYPEEKQWIDFKEWDVAITGTGIHRGTFGQYLGVDKETGKMLYLYEGDVSQDDIIGQTMTINLGTAQICRPLTEDEMSFEEEPGPIIDNSVKTYDGEWSLSVVLEGSTKTIEAEMNSAPTGNPDITLDSVAISPLSIERSTTHCNPEKARAEWDDPVDGGVYNDGFFGFLMKDGTVQSATAGSGRSVAKPGWTGRVEFSGFGTIVDVEEIEALLFEDTTDDIESWELWDLWNAGEAVADDFIVVPLPTE